MKEDILRRKVVVRSWMMKLRIQLNISHPPSFAPKARKKAKQDGVSESSKARGVLISRLKI